jgi:hypothetical protein
LLPPIPCFLAGLGLDGLDLLILGARSAITVKIRIAGLRRWRVVLAEVVSALVAPPVLSSIVVVLELVGKISATALKLPKSRR